MRIRDVRIHQLLQFIVAISLLCSFYFLVPEIEIVDERDKPVNEKFYKGGSTIELKCIVRQIVGQAPEYIIWHHEDRMLNYDTERGGIR